MKISLAIFCSLCSTVYSQVDSSILDYFPLQQGNLWQYRQRSFPGSPGLLWNMVSYGDTVMLNGLKYIKVYPAPYGPVREKYYRIDTLYRIREYSTTYGDTCDELENEFNFFRLNEADSSVWSICRNVGDDLLYPFQLRYLSIYQLEKFGEVRDVKVFRRYTKNVVFGDTLEFYGKTFLLMKGIGIYYTEEGEDESATLEGAIINGVKYGNVVGVFDGENNMSIGFSLFQNYPNPFNNETILTFSLDQTQHIKLEVINTLGQLVSVLEDNVLNSGIHVRAFYAGNISTGMYYLRLFSNNRFAVRKIFHIK